MERRWIKISEAAAMISIHPKSLYALIAKGEIPHSRRSGVGIRIHIDALDAYLREGEVKSVEEQLKRDAGHGKK
jgi:excisionase family DNA binding protein